MVLDGFLNVLPMPNKPQLERAADILDVHILDIAAETEAMLRGIRQVQRSVLQLRGTLEPGDAAPVEGIRSHLTRMRADWDALGDAIQAAMDTAETLQEPVGGDH